MLRRSAPKMVFGLSKGGKSQGNPERGLSRGEPCHVGEVQNRKFCVPRFVSHNRLYWRELVADYNSVCHGFTYRTDIFPAFSGLARSFCNAANIPETDYIAGFWKPLFLRDLFWGMDKVRVTDPRDLFRTQLSPPYICPSWSWMNKGYVES